MGAFALSSSDHLGYVLRVRGTVDGATESTVFVVPQITVENDRITGFKLRQPDPKRCSVKAFKSLDLRVVAAGDFNDVSMLEEADGHFLHAGQCAGVISAIHAG